MTEFSRNLNGGNCQVGGQSIISLSVTEDIDADYDTASAVCLAPGGPHAKGTIVQTVEGGEGTGYWHIGDVTTIRSGERTWRSTGGGAFEHLPLVQYQLRRKNWLNARATISPLVIGRDNFPPKWVPYGDYLNYQIAAINDITAGKLTWDQYRAELAGMRPVGSAEDIIRQICAWVNLPVAFYCSLPNLAPEYSPVNKPAITACKEVAAWSGASCYLNRDGTLCVYDWYETFARGGGGIPMPAVVLGSETHDAIPDINAVTVVGSRRYWATIPSTWVIDPQTKRGSFVGAGWGYKTEAVEYTEVFARAANEWAVEERIEISDYYLTPEIAAKIGRERLARVVLHAGTGTYRGPAEGSQSYCPLDYHCFEVSRQLEWDGSKYRYEIEITGPQSTYSSPSDGGWDF